MFCDDCRAVIFDDKAAAGFVADEDTGRFLKLDQDDGPRRLPVEHQVKDTYPDLSRLSLSASKGCGLCKTLRDTIQSADVEDAMARVGFDGTGNTELTLTMDYVWRAMVCSFGLSMLIVNLNMKRNDGESGLHGRSRGTEDLSRLIEFCSCRFKPLGQVHDRVGSRW